MSVDFTCVCVHCLFRLVLSLSYFFVCVDWLSLFRSFCSIHFFFAQIQYRSSKKTTLKLTRLYIDEETNDIKDRFVEINLCMKAKYMFDRCLSLK
jgi:hypothetical protein